MELRYRIENRGWRIPQFKHVDTGEWTDIAYKHLGKKRDPLHQIAIKLAEASQASMDLRFAPQYYFSPTGGDSKDDESIIFKDDVYVSAFLGAVTIAYKNRTFDFNIGKVNESKKEKQKENPLKASWYGFEGWTVLHRIPIVTESGRVVKDVFSNSEDSTTSIEFLMEQLKITKDDADFYEGIVISKEDYEQELKQVK